MIRIGDYNELSVVRSTSVGIFLEDGEGTEILLPNKYVPENVKLEQLLTVFCYLDHEERPVATTLKPGIIRDGFGYLKVAEINKIGAFLDWGLEKQLLVPFSEQRNRMEVGKSYAVHCFLDERSFRLVASSKLDKFLQKEIQLNVNDEVKLFVTRKTEIGWEVIIEEKFKGLVFFNDVFKPIQAGDRLTGFVKSVREDDKIDITLEPVGEKGLDSSANHIYAHLTEKGGFLPLHDKSAPEEIKSQLGLSKKAFKRGVGILYKQRKIELLPNGIQIKGDQ